MAFAIRPADEPVGLVVAGELLGGRIEVQHPAHARGDVAQVGERGGQVPDLDVGVGPPAASDAVEEVAMVRQAVQR